VSCPTCKGAGILAEYWKEASQIKIVGLPPIGLRLCECILNRLLPDETNLPFLARDTERPGPLENTKEEPTS